MNNVDWNLKLAQGDINDLWQRFADEISIKYEENIPEGKSMSRKYDTPWINDCTCKKEKALEEIQVQ